MQEPSPLSPATATELEQALAHALQFDGRKPFRTGNGMMARITAAHLIEQLHLAGFVVMKKPGAVSHRAPPLMPRGTQ